MTNSAVRGVAASAFPIGMHPVEESSVDDYEEAEIVERIRIRVTCEPEESPYVASAVARMVEGLAGKLRALPEVQRLPQLEPTRALSERR